MKRKTRTTVNVQKLVACVRESTEELGTDDLEKLAKTALRVLLNRTQMDIENSIESGTPAWEETDKKRRDTIKEAYRMLNEMPARQLNRREPEE